MNAFSAGHEEWQDAAAAYLLRALPEDEERDFDRHLASCAICRNTVEELRPASDALALAVPSQPAPAHVRARVMQVVEQEAELLRAAGPAADRPVATPARERGEWRQRASAWWGSPALALSAAVLLLALGAIGGLTAGGAFQDGVATTTVEAQVDPAVAPGTSARLEVVGSRATLVAENLPEPPEGRVYQVWVLRPDEPPEPTDTLFLPRGDGSASAAVADSLEGLQAVLVSHEPPGGSSSPTSDPIITVEPPA